MQDLISNGKQGSLIYTVCTPHAAPFTGEDRYDTEHRGEVFGAMKETWMSQSQRARWLKTAAVVFVVVCLFLFFSPGTVMPYNAGEIRCYCSSPNPLLKTCSIPWRPDTLRFFLRYRQVHQIILERQAHRPVRPDDRRRQHGLSNPRVQVQ